MPTRIALVRSGMAARRYNSPGLVLVAFLTILVLCSCSDGDGGLTAEFTESGTQAAEDLVRIVSGGSSGDVVTVEVVCGETQRTDVYGFAFDLVLSDPSVAEYVVDSAEAGNAFDSMVATAQQNGGRIVIGVSQTDQTGDGVPGPESVLLRLSLRALRAGTTTIRFEGSTGSNPSSEPSAVDSDGDPIGTVVFDPSPASVVGR